MLKKLSKFQRLLNPEQPDSSHLYLITYAVLGLVSLVMTVMNLITGKGPLTWCTGAFTLLSLLNVILTQIGPRTRRAAVALFSIEIIVMFSFFLVTGNPEGFSVIWICMLPSLGLFFFGRDRGSLLCGAMLLILLFFLWTPWGQSILTLFQHPNYTPSFHGYTDSFKMRFPVLFIAFYLLAFFLESMRLFAYREMSRMREYYREQSLRDPLTGIYNRQGMYTELSARSEFSASKIIGAIMFDIDFFKEVNDTYGHEAGDIVLKEFTKLLEDNLSEALLCRWGGEEFVAIYTGSKVMKADLEHLRKTVEQHPCVCDGAEIYVTVSTGVCNAEYLNINFIDRLINDADAACYEAKHRGRNNVVYADKCVSAE